ncbi:MAG: hypothetical protein M1817_000524 [Caeruleum heppii]|nr:MAG: hypothetical protein M1817_000524 [Caeruleum heppii]
MVFESFARNLGDSIHDSYRDTLSAFVEVQIPAVIAFGKQPPLEIECVLTIVKKDSVPNQRSGIILGQYSLLDRLRYRVLPRHVLRARGHANNERVWGDIVLRPHRQESKEG